MAQRDFPCLSLFKKKGERERERKSALCSAHYATPTRAGLPRQQSQNVPDKENQTVTKIMPEKSRDFNLLFLPFFKFYSLLTLNNKSLKKSKSGFRKAKLGSLPPTQSATLHIIPSPLRLSTPLPPPPFLLSPSSSSNSRRGWQQQQQQQQQQHLQQQQQQQKEVGD